MSTDKTSGSGGGGISSADFGFINEAFGQSADSIKNRYKQLGLGNPDPGAFSGDPAQAAAQGGSLQWGSPGTAQRMDIRGLGNMAQAALGTLQNANVNNPAISGSPANLAQQNSDLSNLASSAGQQAGLNSGSSSSGGTDSGTVS